MPRTITRTGRQRAALAAGADLVAEVLADPVAVTALLGDLLDQRRSTPGPPPRWVVPRFRLGLTSVDTTLVPRFERDGRQVTIVAETTDTSDAWGMVRLAMLAEPVAPAACRLETTWRLEIAAPIPRTALRLVAPALDRTVDTTVRRIMRRTEEAVLDASR